MCTLLYATSFSSQCHSQRDRAGMAERTPIGHVVGHINLAAWADGGAMGRVVVPINELIVRWVWRVTGQRGQGGSKLWKRRVPPHMAGPAPQCETGGASANRQVGGLTAAGGALLSTQGWGSFDEQDGLVLRLGVVPFRAGGVLDPAPAGD